MAKEEKNNEFDFSLAEPTDKQKVEEMRVNPYEDTYANYMYGQTEQQQIPREQAQVSAVPNPVPDKMPYVDIQQPNNFHISEDARQAGQKMTGKFIAPNTNPTTFNELMENWRAKDEYDEARHNQKEKWRKISQAIIGAGELVARGLTGASGEAVTPKYMAEHGAQALDELRNLRARNRDQFNMALSHLTQEQQNRLQQQRLARQDAQWQAEMAYKERQLSQNKEKNDNDKAYRDALIKQGDTLNEIRAGEAQSRKAVNASTIARNNAQTSKTKTENTEYMSFGNREYEFPKGYDYSNVLRRLDAKLRSMNEDGLSDDEKKVRQRILKLKYGPLDSHTPNEFKHEIDVVARVMPNIVDDVIRSMQGVKPVSGNGTTTSSTSTGAWGNSINRKKK